MELKEAARVIEQVWDDVFLKHHGKFYSCVVNNGHDGLWLKVGPHKFHSSKSMLYANIFEQIYAKTSFIVVAWTVNEEDDSCMIYLNSTEGRMKTCDSDGTPWDETHYKAKCPGCGETESFDRMKYSPTDYRSMTCPKCGVSNLVQDFYDITAERRA